MLKLDSKKLGPIKIFNVTEARSNFSDILSDRKSPYIITKNNRPLRAIINYEQFEKFLQYLENPTAQNESQLETVVEKNKKTGNRIPGLLKTQQELTIDKTKENEKINMGQSSIPVSTQNVENQAAQNREVEQKIETTVLAKAETVPQSVAVENQDVKNNLASWLNENPNDYFSSSSDICADMEEEGVLLDPGFIVEKNNEEKQYQEENVAREELPSELEVLEKEKVVEIPDDSQASDYFKRYRKLYENQEEWDYTPPIQETSSRNLFKEKTPAPQRQGLQIDSRNRDSTSIRDEGNRDIKNYESQPKWQDPEFLPPQKVNSPSVQKVQNKTSLEEEEIVSQKNVMNPPTLHDLLKELEKEKLIGEDENNMNSGQIDDIIHRLRDNY